MSQYTTWTEPEIEYLKQSAGKISNKEIASTLNKPAHAVKRKALRIGISTSTLKIWNNTEIQFLKENCLMLSCKDCAKHLRRSYKATMATAIKNGISFRPKPINSKNKICSRCLKEKPKNEFYYSRDRKDGLEYLCKTCSSAKGSKYNKNHKDTRNASARRYKAFQYKTNPNFKLLNSLRRSTHKIVKGQKSQSTLDLLGCTINYARKHIESQFSKGMNWKNYGVHGWHVDHIKPCASFDLSNPDEQKACFHYTNLQPLWAKDNWSKGDKINWQKPYYNTVQ